MTTVNVKIEIEFEDGRHISLNVPKIPDTFKPFEGCVIFTDEEAADILQRLLQGLK